MTFLALAGWLACAVYATVPAFWLMIHPWADFWRSRRSPYLLLVPAWIGMWVVAGLATYPWRGITLYSASWARIPGGALLLCGFAIYAVSGRDSGRALVSGMAEVIPGQGEQRLVTTGIRSRMRHPLYLAHLCEMLAWSVGTGLVVCYLLTAVAVVTGAIMIAMEEKELQQRFGEDYTLYCERVPALLPRIAPYNPRLGHQPTSND